jgi:hypothetical protein
MISPNSYSLFYFIFFIAASTAFQIYHRRNPSSICGKRQTFKMMFGNIASKMSDLIEVISGQQTITESNIEASLKVCALTTLNIHYNDFIAFFPTLRK